MTGALAVTSVKGQSAIQRSAICKWGAVTFKFTGFYVTFHTGASGFCMAMALQLLSKPKTQWLHLAKFDAAIWQREGWKFLHRTEASGAVNSWSDKSTFLSFSTWYVYFQRKDVQNVDIESDKCLSILLSKVYLRAANKTNEINQIWGLNDMQGITNNDIFIRFEFHLYRSKAIFIFLQAVGQI